MQNQEEKINIRNISRSLRCRACSSELPDYWDDKYCCDCIEELNKIERELLQKEINNIE